MNKYHKQAEKHLKAFLVNNVLSFGEDTPMPVKRLKTLHMSRYNYYLELGHQVAERDEQQKAAKKIAKGKKTSSSSELVKA